MKKIFAIDVYSFNILLGIITPIILWLLIFNYQNDFSKFSYSWLMTTDFFKFIIILLSYSFPLAFFSSKIYQLLKESNASKVKQLGLMLLSLLFLPFGMILVLILAKVNFIAVIMLAAIILAGYISSYKSKLAFK